MASEAVRWAISPAAAARTASGGRGGAASGSSVAGWVGVSLEIDAGQGGASRGGRQDGGSGGGGFGGGEAGDSAPLVRSGGGAGGGTWARQATVDDTGFPFLGQANPPAIESGAVVFTFDVCAVYPEEFSCD